MARFICNKGLNGSGSHKIERDKVLQTTRFLPREGANDPRTNRLLGMISPASWPIWEQSLEIVEMHPEDAIHEPGHEVRDAYFPIDCVISMLAVLSDGTSTQTGMIGREGVVGLCLFMKQPTTRLRHVVLSAGAAARISASALARGQPDRAFTTALERYALELLTQASYAVACARHHTTEQQLCSLFLAFMDRLSTSHLVLTHDLLAGLLGLRRETVTQAAQKLQARGLVRYRRGHIQVLDRPGIQRVACECYGIAHRLES